VRPVAADLSGKTYLVTGATAGIGKEIARGLLALGARVVVACRSLERGEALRRELGERLDLLELDLGDLASVRAGAARFARESTRLHGLVNNAGVWLTQRTLGPQGHELTFATNVLGHHLLTSELLPLLERAAPSRIVTVASSLAYGLDLDDLMFERRPYGDGMAAYAQSKQANRMLTWALAEPLRARGVTANALHPGMVRTELARDAHGVAGFFGRLFFRFGRTPAKGADTAVWLAASPEVEGVSGKLWKDRKEQRCELRDPAQLEALWAKCEALISDSPAPAPPR
jgi:NAD(P)-dependent dehydrogenase (short-subunit alcohol dehydrogenase family)